MARTVWADRLVTLDVSSGSQNNLSLMAEFTAVETRLAQMTLMRTIIGVHVAATVHDSAEGSQTVDIGLGIASQEAFAAGILADPNSSTDFPTRGWIFRARGRVWAFAPGGVAVDYWRIDRDVRSRRKLENGEPYVIVHNTANEGTAFTIRVSGLIRQLWLVR